MIQSIRRASGNTVSVSVNDQLVLVSPGDSGTTLNVPKSMGAFNSESNAILVEVKDVSGLVSGARKIAWNPATGQTLEPGSTFELSTAHDSMRLFLDGTVWRRLN